MIYNILYIRYCNIYMYTTTINQYEYYSILCSNESTHQSELTRIKQLETIHQFELREHPSLTSASDGLHMCERCSESIRIDE